MAHTHWQLNLIGIDPIASIQSFFLPDDIISALHRLGIFTWDKIILEWSGLSPTWKSAEQIGLSAPLSSTWDVVTTSL